jgi:hypothetical protein
MSKWKDIAKLSDQDAKKREAAFEAEMLASVQKDVPQPSLASPVPTVLIRDGIQISVTENGHTTHYKNLETVPLPLRARIMNAWQPSPNPSTPPLQCASSIQDVPPLPRAARRRSLRFAMALNLLLPGAGQFYIRQPLMGSVYAIGFLACLTTMLLKFLSGYFDYLQLSTSGDILETGNIEQLAHAFPTRTLASLGVVGIAIYFVSSIHLALSSRSK